MITNSLINLRSFKQKLRFAKKDMQTFIKQLAKKVPRRLEAVKEAKAVEVWKETQCLNCANCCKTMTPTFTPEDLTRISQHLGMTEQAFKDKWLYKEKKRNGDWMNRKQPCQFLNLEDNKCTIYEVRPIDCAGFPHFDKKMAEYNHVHLQNIQYCPATFTLMEKIMAHYVKE